MTLERFGEQHVAVVDKYHDPTADYTMTTRDYVVRPTTSTAAITITLPSVAEAKGRLYTVVARAASSAFPIIIQDRDDSEGWGYDAVLSAAGEAQVFYSDGLKWNKASSGGSAWSDDKARIFDDFFGEAYDTVFWGTTETNLNTAIALDQDAIGGILELILDVDDNAEIAAVHFSDNEPLYLEKGLIFEARVAWSVLPLTGTETVQSVIGVAGAHNADLDAIDCSAWFRLESADSDALLWETDDNVTDDDDNDAATVIVAGVYYVLRIDFTNIAAVKFYVDGTLVGTGDMSGLTGAIGQVQPYLNISKEVAANNTGTGTLLIDYIKIIQNRA